MGNFFAREHRWTRIALMLSGILYAILYPKAMWTSETGWMWVTPARNLPMENMLVAMYIVAGIMLFWATRDPVRFLPLIDYTIVANIAHGFVMLNDATRLHMADHLRPSGDVIGTFIVPVLLIVTHPRHFYLDAIFRRRSA